MPFASTKADNVLCGRGKSKRQRYSSTVMYRQPCDSSEMIPSVLLIKVRSVSCDASRRRTRVSMLLRLDRAYLAVHPILEPPRFYDDVVSCGQYIWLVR